MTKFTFKGYLFSWVMIIYLGFFFLLGSVLCSIYLRFLFEDRYGYINDPIIKFVFFIICIAGGVGLAYLANLPLNYIDKKTDFFKKVFPD